MFQNHLSALGFTFMTNVLVNRYEYDILITGRAREKNCPFAELPSLDCDVSSMPAVDLATVIKVGSSNQLEMK